VSQGLAPASQRTAAPPRHCVRLGGGLIGGVVAWYAGTANLVGVEPDEAATLTAALKICTRHISAYLPLPSGLKIVLHHPASAMLVWAQLEWTW